jgi:cation transport regulator ChaC
MWARHQIAYVFGYGSLVGEPRTLVHGGSTYSAVPGHLSGFRRLWGVAMNNWEAAPSRKHFVEPRTRRVPRVRVAFLDLEKKGGAVVNGLAIPVDSAGLTELDVREVNYRRIDVSAAFEPRLRHRVFVYRGTVAARARCQPDSSDAEICVSRQYLTAVKRAFAALEGDGAAAEFERTTAPLAFPVRELELVQPE